MQALDGPGGWLGRSGAGLVPGGGSGDGRSTRHAGQTLGDPCPRALSGRTPICPSGRASTAARAVAFAFATPRLDPGGLGPSCRPSDAWSVPGWRAPSGVGADGGTWDRSDDARGIVPPAGSGIRDGRLRATRAGARRGLEVGSARRGGAPGCFRGVTGAAQAAWSRGAGAEVRDVGGRAALPRVGAGLGGQAEVAADVGDDVGGGAGADVVFEVGGVEALAQLGVECLGGVAVARAADPVLDLSDDAPAGCGAVPGRVGGGSRRACRGCVRGGCSGGRRGRCC